MTEVNDFLKNYGYILAIVVAGIILVVVILLLLCAFVFSKKSKKVNTFNNNDFLSYFGGKENIISVELKGSRVVVSLKDPLLMDKDKIKANGVSSILEMKEKITLVSTSSSQEIYDALKAKD